MISKIKVRRASLGMTIVSGEGNIGKHEVGDDRMRQLIALCAGET